MIKIRLFKKGIKKEKKYIIVVSDSKKSRNGKFIEKIGFYSPLTGFIKINTNRLLYWENIGVKINNSVKKIYKIYKNKCSC